MEDDRPYVVESPTKIKLSPIAKEWAREFGMSDVEMAKHLLAQWKLRNDGQIQGE
jgi:hypothetical protein